MIHFTVYGSPKPKGSKDAYTTRSGRINVVESCREEKAWAELVSTEALLNKPAQLFDKSVGVDLWFWLPRPKRLGKTLKSVMATTKPDIDKLTRSVLDALTGFIYKDDALVSQLSQHKYYADPGEEPRLFVRVWDYDAYGQVWL